METGFIVDHPEFSGSHPWHLDIGAGHHDTELRAAARE